MVLFLLLVVTFVALRLSRSGSLPRIELAGQDVGALDEDSLHEEVVRIAEERGAQEIEVRRQAGPGASAMSRSYERRELGYAIDVDATVARIMERGRQGNPIAAFADQARATFSSLSVDPVVTVDQERLDRWVARVEKEFATSASEGGISFKGTRVDAELPKPGASVDVAALRERAEDLALDDEALSLIAPVQTLEPDMTAGDVRRAKERAQRIVSAPVTLKYSGREATLSADEIASVLSARNVEEDGDTRIVLEVDRSGLQEAISSSLGAIGRPPTDASLTLSDGRVRVIGGSPGIAVDGKRLADSLLRIASSDDRTAVAPVKKVQPEFSAADARALDINEQVSTFTTYHSCCEPRVENIHRIADLIDGTVVRPGDTFSINDSVGPRTRANGFVPAPAILNGEYVEEVGGGISQFATTTFNAVFFGGYEFLEYKAHSYYISRYPMGREATVSFPYPDLEFRNDSDSGIYIDTSYTDTSITVTFYGNDGGKVRSISGEPHNYKAPSTQCEENDSLRRGQKVVTQTGSRGFDITVTRVLPDGTREDFNTTYLPVPEIVEKRNC
jgi:vancomycin resistance protein YoaR